MQPSCSNEGVDSKCKHATGIHTFGMSSASSGFRSNRSNRAKLCSKCDSSGAVGGQEKVIKRDY